MKSAVISGIVTEIAGTHTFPDKVVGLAISSLSTALCEGRAKRQRYFAVVRDEATLLGELYLAAMGLPAAHVAEAFAAGDSGRSAADAPELADVVRRVERGLVPFVLESLAEAEAIQVVTVVPPGKPHSWARDKSRSQARLRMISAAALAGTWPLGLDHTGSERYLSDSGRPVDADGTPVRVPRGYRPIQEAEYRALRARGVSAARRLVPDALVEDVLHIAYLKMAMAGVEPSAAYLSTIIQQVAVKELQARNDLTADGEEDVRDDGYADDDVTLELHSTLEHVVRQVVEDPASKEADEVRKVDRLRGLTFAVATRAIAGLLEEGGPSGQASSFLLRDATRMRRSRIHEVALEICPADLISEVEPLALDLMERGVRAYVTQRLGLDEAP